MNTSTGSLVLHFWVGSACTLTLTPGGIKRMTRHATADDMIASMVEEKKALTHDGEHILPLPWIAQHGILCGTDNIFITADGTIVTGPTQWGHA